MLNGADLALPGKVNTEIVIVKRFCHEVVNIVVCQILVSFRGLRRCNRLRIRRIHPTEQRLGPFILRNRLLLQLISLASALAS